MARLQAEMAFKDQVIIEQLGRIAELERALEESRRGGKRQAAPFSKGDPKPTPKRSGRKRGDAHGRHGHRPVPVGRPDRELDAGLPSGCQHCGGTVTAERVETQWQVDIPPQTPTVTKFNIPVGHCTGCGRRVQGHHPEQTSDAPGAAASQVGPSAKAWAMWLHYSLGLSFGRTRQVLARLGINVTAGALCTASATAASTNWSRSTPTWSRWRTARPLHRQPAA
jgi:transposase